MYSSRNLMSQKGWRSRGIWFLRLLLWRGFAVCSVLLRKATAVVRTSCIVVWNNSSARIYSSALNHRRNGPSGSVSGCIKCRMSSRCTVCCNRVCCTIHVQDFAALLFPFTVLCSLLIYNLSLSLVGLLSSLLGTFRWKAWDEAALAPKFKYSKDR